MFQRMFQKRCLSYPVYPYFVANSLRFLANQIGKHVPPPVGPRALVEGGDELHRWRNSALGSFSRFFGSYIRGSQRFSCSIFSGNQFFFIFYFFKAHIYFPLFCFTIMFYIYIFIFFYLFLFYLSTKYMMSFLLG